MTQTRHKFPLPWSGSPSNRFDSIHQNFSNYYGADGEDTGSISDFLTKTGGTGDVATPPPDTSSPASSSGASASADSTSANPFSVPFFSSAPASSPASSGGSSSQSAKVNPQLAGILAGVGQVFGGGKTTTPPPIKPMPIPPATTSPWVYVGGAVLLIGVIMGAVALSKGSKAPIATAPLGV